MRRVLEPGHIGDSFSLAPSTVESGTRGRGGTKVNLANYIWFIPLDTGRRIVATTDMLRPLA